jgi:hypothetical protein
LDKGNKEAHMTMTRRGMLKALGVVAAATAAPLQQRLSLLSSDWEVA